MNDFNSWTDINWYALGSLLAQFAFLAAGLWFASNLLKTIRVFQEQVGALLKLSITSSPGERQSLGLDAKRSPTEASPYWLAPSEPQTSSGAEPIESRPGWLLGAWRGLVHWLQAPMHTAQVSAWRRLINWLQAPAGS
jgi:hypothetical protein